ncbi:hypothetical protein ACFL30_03410 [Candidatus Latescibacterota bacterium]
MEHTYEELKKMTVAQMRKIASEVEHEAVQGYTQMHKEQLLKALCAAFGLEMHEHHIAKTENKTGIKTQIKGLKKKRDEAIDAHDHKELKVIRRKIHRLKRSLHRATV